MTKKKRNIFIALTSVIVLIVLLIIVSGRVICDSTYTIKSGEFESVIVTKGEIRSQVYTKINMPEVMTDPDLNIYYLKINDLVEEGTLVKKGDYVALLDQERIKSELNRTSERLENYENEFRMRKIDSTSVLTDLRNTIVEIRYDLEYKEISIKQSIYESKSYQEKVKREYNREARKLEMTERDYQRKQMQHASRCAYTEKRLNEYKKRLEKLEKAVIEARITAPMDGMIIYARPYGRPRVKGDHVSFWSPEIAVLPDLTKLVSDSYVEEIDISKIKVGDKVRTSVDALPDKVFAGHIIKIANIGKSVQGVDSKVFDISVKIEGADDEIAHGMNTTNEIITHYEPNAVLVPLNYVFTNEKGTLVYKKVDGIAQEWPISISYTNDDNALVSQGLEVGDVIYTSQPNELMTE